MFRLRGLGLVPGDLECLTSLRHLLREARGLVAFVLEMLQVARQPRRPLGACDLSTPSVDLARLRLELLTPRALATQLIEVASQILAIRLRLERRITRLAGRVLVLLGDLLFGGGPVDELREGVGVLSLGALEQGRPLLLLRFDGTAQLGRHRLEPFGQPREAPRLEDRGQDGSPRLVVGHHSAEGPLRQHHGLPELVHVAAQHLLDGRRHVRGLGREHLAAIELLEAALGLLLPRPLAALLRPLLGREPGDAEALAEVLELEHHLGARPVLRVLDRRLLQGAHEVRTVALTAAGRTEQRETDRVQHAALARTRGAVDEEEAMLPQRREVHCLLVQKGPEPRHLELQGPHASAPSGSSSASTRSASSSSPMSCSNTCR